MQKSPDAFRTISEVADWLGVQAHVLRFWESKFSQIKPIKRAGGRRYYRPADMQLLGGIKKLLHEDGMTIKGVQKTLREEGTGFVCNMSPPLDAVTDIEAEIEEAPMIEVETPDIEAEIVPFDSATPVEAAPVELAQPDPAPAEDIVASLDDPMPFADLPEQPLLDLGLEPIAPAEPALPADEAIIDTLPDTADPVVDPIEAQTDTADDSATPMKARDIGMPKLTPEDEMDAAPATLTGSIKLRRISLAVSHDMRPLLTRLATLRDAMQSQLSAR